MDLDLFERLLLEGEGPRLDYKSTSYDIESPDDAIKLKQKAELIKDIVAMVNAHRSETAYILLGVKEVKGEPARVVGADLNLEDASLHQLVDSKLNRPIAFKYVSFQAHGKAVAAIEIPVQQRPVFLPKQFGSLRPEAVYVRRGSWTGIAGPTEIAEVGAADAVSAIKPRLTFEGRPSHRPVSRVLNHATRTLPDSFGS